MPEAAVLIPPSLQRFQEGCVHGRCDVGVDAADAGESVAEALAFEDFDDAVFVHPGAVGVPQVVEPRAGQDRLPATVGVSVAAGRQVRAVKVERHIHLPVGVQNTVS